MQEGTQVHTVCVQCTYMQTGSGTLVAVVHTLVKLSTLVKGGPMGNASLRLAERKKANMKNSMKREPNISNIEVDDKGEITIESVNIKEITCNYYIIDAEILFSR